MYGERLLLHSLPRSLLRNQRRTRGGRRPFTVHHQLSRQRMVMDTVHLLRLRIPSELRLLSLPLFLTHTPPRLLPRIRLVPQQLLQRTALL